MNTPVLYKSEYSMKQNSAEIFNNPSVHQSTTNRELFAYF